MRNLLRTAAAALAVFTAWVGPHSNACPGERELLTSFGNAAVVERLDVQFPARLVAVEPCPTASFTHRGQRHELPTDLAGDGAQLRLVRVAHAGGEGTLLVRAGGDAASLPAAPPR
jgi:hypothetical protein